MHNLSKSKILKYLLFALPVMEIAGFIIVSGWVGILPTILLIISTTFLGLAVLRTQGFPGLIGMQKRIKAGKHPAINIADSTLRMFGGLLLVIPGFITDVLGLFLLIPRIRSLILRWILSSGVMVNSAYEFDTQIDQGITLDGEFQKEENT